MQLRVTNANQNRKGVMQNSQQFAIQMILMGERHVEKKKFFDGHTIP